MLVAVALSLVVVALRVALSLVVALLVRLVVALVLSLLCQLSQSCECFAFQNTAFQLHPMGRLHPMGPPLARPLHPSQQLQS